MMLSDEEAMRLALSEARRGIGLTSPNPPVGAVIVSDGRVLASGWHRKAGGPHAEIDALHNCDRNKYCVAGATIYITLEPCSSHGRTPPCVEALINAKLSRVVWGSRDPNPAHLGRAENLLQAAGIEVTTGICEQECGGLLRPFTKKMLFGLPWVIAKAGMSLDGKITRPVGEGQWITSPEARQDAMTLRGQCDAILVGAGTLRADNPSLTLRGPGTSAERIQPWRVVLTRSGDLPSSATVFTDQYRDRTLVFRKTPMEDILRDLVHRGVLSVLVEGGSEVLAMIFAGGFADEVVFYVAPLISGNGKTVVSSNSFFGGSVPLDFVNIQHLGPDLRLQALVRKEGVL